MRRMVAAVVHVRRGAFFVDVVHGFLFFFATLAQLLTADTMNHVNSILPAGETLESDSTWADQVRYQAGWKVRAITGRCLRVLYWLFFSPPVHNFG